MADPFPPPPDGGGPFQALLPYLSGLAGLIVVMTGVFWVVGQVRGGEPVATVDESTPTPTVAASPEPTAATAAPSPTSTAPASPTPTPTPTPTATGAVAPGDVSVQVLDGGGGEAATELAAELRDDDYNVVAENQALARDETTVFYTEGNEEAAQQIASQYDLPAVEEAPGNLSAEVDVHIVVGSDRAP